MARDHVSAVYTVVMYPSVCQCATS